MSTTASSVPSGGLAALRAHGRGDLLSGFLVFLIALPLCLGISIASGFPPVAGILTAIVGGLISTFIGGGALTIKGPAAGLIVIALGAVTELGGGDAVLGYRRALAVGAVAAVVQIGFALMRAGRLGDVFPPSVVHGMLAAIGVIIFAKQVHVMLGVVPTAREPLHLLAEIPSSLGHLNPEVALIGLTAAAILFLVPRLPVPGIRRLPMPMLVLLVAVPMGLVFDLEHPHTYVWTGEVYRLGPEMLVRLPASLGSAITFPDFSAVLTLTGLKYVVMYALVGSIESLLSAKAVDSLDPEHRKTDLDRDLLAVGVGNLVASMIGGLPMISEIVRSSANADNGAKTRWANFFHGVFLLGSVALIPHLVQEIPLAALAAMLVYTGVRLASPLEFRKTWKIGREQMLVFGTTFGVTLATDLLLGVAAGVVVKVLVHLARGTPARALLRPPLHVHRTGGEARLSVREALVFTNYLVVKSAVHRLAATGVHSMVLDVSATRVVDHTAMEGLHDLRATLQSMGCDLQIVGLDALAPVSEHPLAARTRARAA